MKTIKHKPIVLPEQACMVKNYNKGMLLERGTCQSLELHISKHGDIQAQYCVVLDRISLKGNYLFVTVGPESITAI